jgi:hypothetical protein
MADSIFERDNIPVVVFPDEVETVCWSVEKVSI